MARNRRADAVAACRFLRAKPTRQSDPFRKSVTSKDILRSQTSGLKVFVGTDVTCCKYFMDLTGMVEIGQPAWPPDASPSRLRCEIAQQAGIISQLVRCT
jgi:hypothetical protein